LCLTFGEHYRIPYISNITGLGSVFEKTKIIQTIVILFYKIAFRKISCLFFQNEANKRFFENKKIAIGKHRIIPGSGVNLTFHCFEEYPDNDDKITFLFIGRVMKEKGIEELLGAAKTIKTMFQNTEFILIGPCEDHYYEKLKEYELKGIVQYYGKQDNVHSFIKNSHAIVHPSYHEGMANVLLESASTGRPVLASNISGCKETFDEGISGFGFKVKNTEDLIEKLIEFIKLPHDQKREFGLAGRKKMEKEFDRQIVINAYLKEINKIINL
jgi:glycosyltransferase involved in cell wall biosynthesis